MISEKPLYPFGTLEHVGTTNTNEAFERMKEVRENVNAQYIPGNILYVYTVGSKLMIKNQYDVIIDSDEIFNLIKNDIVNSMKYYYYRKKNCSTKVYRYLDKDITVDFTRLPEYNWKNSLKQYCEMIVNTITPDL